jgi:ribose-phosphate pyrophosphokinase
MKILNLDPDFHIPAADSIGFETFTFHGGEPHLKLHLPPASFYKKEEVLILQRIRRSGDFMLLLLATDALRRAGYRRLSVLLPYFPAARQDRVMTPGEPLSVKVYTQIINAQHFERVWIFDPHSDVVPALLDSVEVISNENFIKKAIQKIDSQSLALVAPDAGAAKKLRKLAGRLDNPDLVLCEKQRDVQNGQLTGFQVFSKNLEGRDCLIVDDICDGGATFTGIAKALKMKNAGRVFLAVSHGIFSDGFEKLEGLLDGIFTTDSFKNVENERVVQVSLAELIPEIFHRKSFSNFQNLKSLVL